MIRLAAICEGLPAKMCLWHAISGNGEFKNGGAENQVSQLAKPVRIIHEKLRGKANLIQWR
jgi:hypothetical protein